MSLNNEKQSLDLYNILNLSRNASQADIKSAFRQLSLQYHPDKDRNSRDKNNDEKYKNILMAYETLSDISKKNIYDLQFNNKNNINSSIVDNNTNVKEIIETTEINNNSYLPETIYKILEITLNQSFLGCILPMEIEKNIEYNKRITKELETIYVRVPIGIDNNEIITIKDKGNSINNIIFGDIKIQIKIKKHDLFIRKGLDLIYKKEITLKESLCGFIFIVDHINKKKYTIKNDGINIIKPGQEQIIPNLGITRDNYIGNLVINFSIIYPDELSLEQKKKLKEIL